MNQLLDQQQKAEQQKAASDEELNQLRLHNLSMMDEQKEMEMTIKELRKENASLKRSALDRTKWMEWDSEQVFMFIMSSVEDGSLDQYEEVIRAEVFESEYSGEALADITSSEIKDMGIKNIMVRKAVLRAIHELVKGNKHMDTGSVADNEGLQTAYL